MQNMQVFIYCKITLHVSGVHRTHHQEYIKLTAISGTGHSIRATTFLQRGQIGHVGGRLLLGYYDLYQRLQLQFYVLLTIGAMKTRNM